MDRRGGLEGAAGEAEVFGAAAGLEVRGVVGDGADGGEDVVEVFGQGQGEEVVQVIDVAADGGGGEAGGGGAKARMVTPRRPWAVKMAVAACRM